MPHYHFHCAGSVRASDTIGTELPNDEAAQQLAVAFAGETVRFAPKSLENKGHWRVEVTDDHGAFLLPLSQSR